MKTDKQTVLELQRSKPIKEIVREALVQYAGQRMVVARVALDLGVTDATVYKWCEELGIDIDEYRRPAPDAEKAAQKERERVLAEGGGE